MDQGEEQVDYGDGEHGNGGIPTHFHGGAAAAMPLPPQHHEEQQQQEEEYDDLYQDVNVGFIEPQVALHTSLPQQPLPRISPPPPPSELEDDHDPHALALSSSAPVPPEEETGRFGGVRGLGGESTSGHRGGGSSSPTSTPRQHSAPTPSDSGARSVFVGDLHWWTTDADLEAALSEYGRVKEITFFQERASGKSKGFCQVHFYDSVAARACKEGMNGRVFNGRPCVVAYKSPRSLKDSTSNVKDNKRVANDSVSARGYEGGRNYGRSGRGSHGQQGQGRGLGQGRGRSSKGGGNSGGGHYGQGLLGPIGMQQPQPMAPQGFEPTFGRGGGGSGWSSFPGMVAPYAPVGSMGIPLAGVAPHVNPAFFNRGLAGNGMGMMPSANANSPVMEQTMWSDWAAEGPNRRGTDSSHGDDGYGYGYGDRGGAGGRSNAPRARDSEWIGNTPEKRHRNDKDVDWDRERERERYRDKERNLYRDQRNNWEKDDDYERERVAARPRSKSRALEEDDPHSHPRPLPDYGKRRR